MHMQYLMTWLLFCRRLRHILHRCDRAMIYIFIAGSYFPWLTIQELPTHGWSSSMKWFVWLLAILGITYQQTFHEKYKCLETIFYLIMGIGPSLFIICEVKTYYVYLLSCVKCWMKRAYHLQFSLSLGSLFNW